MKKLLKWLTSDNADTARLGVEIAMLIIVLFLVLNILLFMEVT